MSIPISSENDVRAVPTVHNL